MATRRDETDSVKRKAVPAAKKKTSAAKTAPRKKPAAKKAVRAPEAASPSPSPSPEPAAPAGAKGLLRAGLKALGNVRDDVVKHQTHVIEGLLGIGKSDASGGKGVMPRGFPGLDSFGIRKFEDVFDQRVATALERLGMPSAQEIQQLRDEVQRLRAQIEQMQAGRRKR